MRFRALATDFDETLADRAHVARNTLLALARFQNRNGRLVLVTGRELPALREVFPHLERFDCVVLENGALLYVPSTGCEKVLARRPPAAFVRSLHRLGVTPISVGRCVVATVRTHEKLVRKAIREHRLKLRVILNRESLMILPAGVDKGSGLKAALAQLQLSPSQVAGIGDAENDSAFLRRCGFSMAVANAIPTMKKQVDLVTTTETGDGVIEAIETLLGQH